MSRSSNWLSIWVNCPDGMVWPRAAAVDLTPIITWSNSLRLISKPLPLAITGSPNNAVIAAWALTLVAVDAGALVAALAEAALTRGSANKATANAAGKINFICFFIFVFFRFNGFYNFRSEERRVG